MSRAHARGAPNLAILRAPRPAQIEALERRLMLVAAPIGAELPAPTAHPAALAPLDRARATGGLRLSSHRASPCQIVTLKGTASANLKMVELSDGAGLDMSEPLIGPSPLQFVVPPCFNLQTGAVIADRLSVTLDAADGSKLSAGALSVAPLKRASGKPGTATLRALSALDSQLASAEATTVSLAADSNSANLVRADFEGQRRIGSGLRTAVLAYRAGGGPAPSPGAVQTSFGAVTPTLDIAAIALLDQLLSAIGFSAKPTGAGRSRPGFPERNAGTAVSTLRAKAQLAQAQRVLEWVSTATDIANEGLAFFPSVGKPAKLLSAEFYLVFMLASAANAGVAQAIDQYHATQSIAGTDLAPEIHFVEDAFKSFATGQIIGTAVGQFAGAHGAGTAAQEIWSSIAGLAGTIYNQNQDTANRLVTALSDGAQNIFSFAPLGFPAQAPGTLTTPQATYPASDRLVMTLDNYSTTVVVTPNHTIAVLNSDGTETDYLADGSVVTGPQGDADGDGDGDAPGDD